MRDVGRNATLALKRFVETREQVVEPFGDGTQLHRHRVGRKARLQRRSVNRGSLLADRFTTSSVGALVLGRLKFTGSLGVAPVVNTVAGSITPWLTGLLEITNATTPGNVRVLGFEGSMSVPQRPTATLNVSITETPATATSAVNYSLSGRYVQSGATVQLSGTQNSVGTSATFADASGVSVSVTSGATTANITVSGRQTAVINKVTKRIEYIDGSFESLV